MSFTWTAFCTELLNVQDLRAIIFNNELKSKLIISVTQSFNEIYFNNLSGVMLLLTLAHFQKLVKKDFKDNCCLNLNF